MTSSKGESNLVRKLILKRMADLNKITASIQAHLSASIQAQTASFQQDYDELIKFLKTTYGKIEVNSGGLLTELEKRKKPADSNFQERAESLLAIANVMLRIRNLKTKLPEEQVTAEITSYNFLHRIRNLLSTMDYMELTKDLIDNNLDARVATGEKALELMLGRIRKTIALLEPMVEKSRTKPKVKSVHTFDAVKETPHIEVRADSRDKSRDLLYRIDARFMKSGKWWDPSLKFPCLVDSHSHKLYQCVSFLGMTRKERHERLKGRISRTCLKPRGICVTKGKKCGSKVTKGLICDCCVQYIQGKNLSPHNILYCTSDRPKSTPQSPSFTRPCRSTLGAKLRARSPRRRSAMDCM